MSCAVTPKPLQQQHDSTIQPPQSRGATALATRWPKRHRDELRQLIEEGRAALRSDDEDVRLAYVRAIGLHGDHAVVMAPDLVNLLLTVQAGEPLNSLHRSILMAGPAALPYLERVALTSDKRAKLEALQSAVRIGCEAGSSSAPAVDYVRKILNSAASDQDEDVASAAREGLSFITHWLSDSNGNGTDQTESVPPSPPPKE